MATPPRRWFAFRLRTLFVVVAVLALPLGWVAYSLDRIRQRHVVMETEWRHARWCDWTPEEQPMAYTISAPWQLRLFGELGAWRIWLSPADSIEKFKEICGLFPEAEVGFYFVPLSYRNSDVRMDFERPYQLRFQER